MALVLDVQVEVGGDKCNAQKAVRGVGWGSDGEQQSSWKPGKKQY